MKTTLTILAAAMVALPAMAETAPADTFDGVSALSAKRLSGSFTLGYDSNFTGRGYVVSHSVGEGDSAPIIALKTSYDFGKKGYWSVDNAIVYHTATSGHTLYGNPNMGPNVKMAALTGNLMNNMGMSAAQAQGTIAAALAGANFDGADGIRDFINNPQKIKQCNLENEFAVVTTLHYKREKWNVAFGHTFVHGGIVGVMAKHFRGQGASCTNEAFITPSWTPAPWIDLGVTTRYSFQGMLGWWFEPYVTFKAPIIGDPEHIKMAALLTFSMAATADYFQDGDFACANGSQTFWIKLSTPYFVRDNFIVTPYVSFNWLGKGAMKANEDSKFKQLTENSTMVPFREFGVVAGVTATYTF